MNVPIIPTRCTLSSSLLATSKHYCYFVIPTCLPFIKIYFDVNRLFDDNFNLVATSEDSKMVNHTSVSMQWINLLIFYSYHIWQGILYWGKFDPVRVLLYSVCRRACMCLFTQYVSRTVCPNMVFSLLAVFQACHVMCHQCDVVDEQAMSSCGVDGSLLGVWECMIIKHHVFSHRLR